MIRMYSSYTEEIDEVNDAVDELLRKIPLDGLLPNSVGIVTCYNEFVDSGVVRELAARLPFGLVGSTVIANGADGRSGNMSLCLSVITADDVEFSCVMSEPLESEGLEQTVRNAYADAASRLCGEPKLIIPFLPAVNTELGFAVKATDRAFDFMVKAIDKASNGTPIFGAVANNSDAYLQQALTIFGDAHSSSSIAMLVISGNIQPRFFIKTLTRKGIQKQKAVITDSHENIIKTVNNLPFVKFLGSLGLTDGTGIGGATSIPLIVEFNDGTQPAAVAIYRFTDEGYAICATNIPAGSTISIGYMDTTTILSSAEAAVKAMLGEKQNNGILIFPCLSRGIELGANLIGEFELVAGLIGADTPYHIAYSGGEICPVYSKNDELVNRFHNFTFVACAF